MSSPLLAHKHYDAASVFTAENLLREARRQKSIAGGEIPAVCVLDPDGDLAAYLEDSGQATRHPSWACYHTRLLAYDDGTTQFGIVPYAVGASFAVLVAEELFASGCQLLISVTSAGQITPIGQPPYFVLIERALRDEGTSHHYLPPAPYSTLRPALASCLTAAFDHLPTPMHRGVMWTTDAPFRETPEAIRHAQSEGILGVEMESAALYAFAEAQSKAVVCFAHITNQMAQIDGDFEKGADQGNQHVLAVIAATARAWQKQQHEQRQGQQPVSAG
jgi:uridine phosphorylase